MLSEYENKPYGIDDKIEFEMECVKDEAEVKLFKDEVDIIPDGER